MQEQTMEEKLWVDSGKMQGIERENFREITVCARSDNGYSGPEDAAGQNARLSVLHENDSDSQKNSQEHSCMESSGSKN
jgi:hypothetical protein